MRYTPIVGTAIHFLVAFVFSIVVAAGLERLGGWIFWSRSGGSGGPGPWRWRPMPPRPRPYGGATAERPARRPPRIGARR
jgi:hypothetical protein